MSSDVGAGLVVFATGFAAGSIAAQSNWQTLATAAQELQPMAQVAVPAVVIGVGVALFRVAYRALRRWTLADYEIPESELEAEQRDRQRRYFRAVIHHRMEHPLTTNSPHLAGEWAQRDADAGRCAFCGKDLT